MGLLNLTEPAFVLQVFSEYCFTWFMFTGVQWLLHASFSLEVFREYCCSVQWIFLYLILVNRCSLSISVPALGLQVFREYFCTQFRCSVNIAIPPFGLRVFSEYWYIWDFGLQVFSFSIIWVWFADVCWIFHAANRECSQNFSQCFLKVFLKLAENVFYHVNRPLFKWATCVCHKHAVPALHPWP